MSLQERLNLLVRTDIRLLETCDLRLNGLFFPKYILVLFIGYKTDLMSDPAKSEIRIVLTQEQTVLRSRCHHAVRLMIFLCHKIIDKDPDIRLGTIKNHRVLLLKLSRRVHTGHKALNGCLLISGASVKLAAGEQSVNIFKLQGRL